MVDRPVLLILLHAAHPDEPYSSSVSELSASEHEDVPSLRQVDHWFVVLGGKSRVIFKDIWVSTF